MIRWDEIGIFFTQKEYYPIDPIPNLFKIDPKWNVNTAILILFVCNVVCVCNVLTE